MGDLILQTIVVVGIGILGFVLKHIQQWNKYKHIPGVRQILPESPFAFPIPYLGPYLFRGNYKTMVELSHQFRDHEVFQVTAGWSTYVFSNSPKVAKRVMTSNNYHKPTILYSGLTIFGDNIVTAAGGHAHRRHHKVVNPAFFPSNLKYLARVSNRSTDLLMERIIANGGTMEVNKDMTDVTVDIIGKSNFGVDLGVFESADTEDDTLSILDKSDQTLSFYEALATTSTWAVVLWSVFPPSLIRLHRPIWNAKTAVQNYILDLLNQRRKKGFEARSDLISLLLKSNELGEGESRLTDQEILSNTFIFLFAGHETSATVMGHLFCELAKNPHIQTKCIDEIDRELEGRSFSYDSSLPYVQKCINECLRMHSPIVAVPKVAKGDDTLGGFNIPRGTNILVNTYIAHMNEKIWEAPLVFDPDRSTKKYETTAFQAFSYGTRTCVGKKFAMTEITAIVVRFLQNYRFEFPSNIDPLTHEPVVETLVTAKIQKEHLILKRRSTPASEEAS